MGKLLAKIPQGLLCLSVGGLTAFAFAPYNIYVIPFITSAILFITWRKNNKTKAFINGYLYGLGLFGVGVNWLHISINLFAGVNLIGAYALTFLLIAYLSLFPALVGYLGSYLGEGRRGGLPLHPDYGHLGESRRGGLPLHPDYGHLGEGRRGGRPLHPLQSDYGYFLALMPALWTLSEWVRSWLFTGFPWLSLGYTQTDTILSGYASLIGTFGVSFIIVFLSGVFALLARSDKKILLASILLAVLAFGWWSRQQQWTENRSADIEVALIQGAIPQEVKWLPEYKKSSLELYLSLTEPFRAYDLIIWPETAIPSYLHNEREFIGELDSIARNNGAMLLVGLPTKDLNTGEYFNSLLLLGGKEQVYNKRHLVPFGEYVPLKPLLGDLIALMQIPMSNFTPGDLNARPVLHGSEFSMGVSICYEDTFGNEIIEALPDADLLVNVSNDAWFGDSASPHQHLQMARMRAIETGRYMARATNTGISAIINEKGRIIGKTTQFKPDAVATKISLFRGNTPYALTGDIPVALLSLLLLLLVWSRPSIKPGGIVRANKSPR